MPRVAELNVALNASVGAFRAGMRQAGNALQSFQRTARQVQDGLGRFGLAIEGLQRANEILQTTFGFEATGNLLRFSDAIGVSVARLGALRFAFARTGIDSDRFNDSIRDLSERIADAAINGAGSYVEALENIGLNAEELNRLGADEQLLAVADGLSRIGDAGLRANSAMTLMGDAGFELLPVLQQGSAAIREMADEAERLGLIMDDAAAQGVQLANEEINELQTRMGNVSTFAGGQFAPRVAGAVEQINEAWDDGSLILDAYAVNLELLTGNFSALADRMGEITDRAARIRGEAEALANASLGTAEVSGIPEQLLPQVEARPLGIEEVQMDAIRAATPELQRQIRERQRRDQVEFFRQLQQDAGALLVQTFDKVREFGDGILLANPLEKEAERAVAGLESLAEVVPKVAKEMEDVVKRFTVGPVEAVGRIFRRSFGARAIDINRTALQVERPGGTLTDDVGQIRALLERSLGFRRSTAAPLLGA